MQRISHTGHNDFSFIGIVGVNIDDLFNKLFVEYAPFHNLEIDQENLMVTVEPGVITGDIHRAVDHMNLTTQWAQSKATPEQLEEITDTLLLAMHDLRTVLVRKKADRLTKE